MSKLACASSLHNCAGSQQNAIGTQTPVWELSTPPLRIWSVSIHGPGGKGQSLLTPQASSKGLEYQEGQRTGLRETSPATRVELVTVFKARKGFLYQLYQEPCRVTGGAQP